MRTTLFILAIAMATPSISASPAESEAAKPDADKEKLICKREVPIGSLIATRKTCLTKSQWVAREIDGNSAARKLIEDNQGRPTTN